MGTTISTHIGQTVADNHNLRRGNFRNADHIDPNGKFEVWTYTSLEKHFENCFGDAIAKYNQGKKPSRQIKNYLKDIKDNPKTVPQYEMIVQVGGTFSPFGSDTPEESVCEEILKEFYEEFQKEFPTMVVRSACYHADEATPHLHLDYTPVAPNVGKNCRGPELVCSQTKALEALGLNNKEFTAKANQLLENICVKHGIEVVHPYRDAGIKGKHLGTEDYKTFQHAVNQFTTARLEATKIVEETQLGDVEAIADLLDEFKNLNTVWKDKAKKEKRDLKKYEEREGKLADASWAIDDMKKLKEQIEKLREYKQQILELVPDYNPDMPVQSQIEAPEM